MQTVNYGICVHGLGAQTFSVLLSSILVDYHFLQSGSQCFPFKYYENYELCEDLFANQNSFFANQNHYFPYFLQ